MRILTKHSRGFSAVELLITLFIGALMLAAGYQLFNIVIRDGGETRAESTVGNAAYDYMRRYAESATNPCTEVAGLPTTESISITSIANPTLTVAITCPQADTPTLSRVEVSISYGLGEDQDTVKVSTYVDKSTGAATTTDVTDGLIGWWKLNGNGNSATGSYNGTSTNTSNATGQNGINANAFAFNGSSSYVAIPLATLPQPTAAFSVTGWFYTSTLTQTVIASTTEAGGWSLSIAPAACTTGLYANIYVNGAYVGACSGTSTVATSTWYFGALVYNGSNVKVYLNSTTPVTSATSGAMTWPANSSTPYLCIGSEPNTYSCTVGNYFNGTLDDVRFYGRELSSLEIGQLISGGAK